MRVRLCARVSYMVTYGFFYHSVFCIHMIITLPPPPLPPLTELGAPEGCRGLCRRSAEGEGVVTEWGGLTDQGGGASESDRVTLGEVVSFCFFCFSSANRSETKVPLRVRGKESQRGEGVGPRHKLLWRCLRGGVVMKTMMMSSPSSGYRLERSCNTRFVLYR